LHHYYYDPEKLDISVIRSDANNRARGKGIHNKNAEQSIIHFHPKDKYAVCDENDLSMHEHYGRSDGKVHPTVL
jgi:hypothetical protein